MNPGCTAVSSTSEFSSPPGWLNRIPSSVMSSAPPTFRNTLRNVIISSWRAPSTVMSPWVASAAHAQDAASIRSGNAAWVYPPSRSTPSIRITRSVSTLMMAPIFCSTAIRSRISGSTAALRSSVTPSARTAVSSTCSVVPTLG